MSVVGIDFGYSNAVIAAAGRGGVDILLNGNSNRLNPSMVGFDRSRSLGEAAATTASSNFKNTIYGMKRLVGLTYEQALPEIQKWCLFSCVPFERASGPPSVGVQVQFNDETLVLPVEAVAGMMVKHLGTIAAARAAPPSNDAAAVINIPQDWVIGIPAYYTDAQRRSLLVGCEIAGIQGVQRLMHESTAVALSYGIFKDLKKEFTEPTSVMFIDIGATQYCCSIATFETGKLAIRAVHFDENLGGRDFDLEIAEWISNQFVAKYGNKLSGKPMEKPKTRLKLLAAAEKAKKTLSPQGVKEVSINLECLMDDFDFHTNLSAAEYEKMCQPLLARLNGPVERCLKEVGLSASDLSSVEIVGGSTRIGCVKRHLQDLLGISTLSTTMNADEAVARGAALQSAILSPRFKVLPYEIAEAQLFPIELSWEGEEDNSVVMFDRGLTFPIVRRVTLKRQGAFQLKCSYHESSKQYGVDPQELCTFTIMAPPDELKKVRVNVKEDLHGIINLSSGQMVEEVVDGEEGGEEDHHEGEGDKKVKVKKTLLDFTTQRPLEWTVEEIQAQFEKEVQMANADRVVRETSDMRNELESYIYSMRDKIIADLAQYATEEERAAFSSALEQTENWLYEDGFDATKSVYAEKLAELQKSGNPIQIRQIESSTRPSAVSSLQRALEHYTQFVNDTSDATAHITDEERQVCHKTLDDISAWMYDMLDKQGNLPPHVSPVLTVSELQKKTQELNKVCSPIRNKPKPKPPKEEKKEEKKEEDTKMEDDGKEGAMETEDGGEKPQENGEEEPMEMD